MSENLNDANAGASVVATIPPDYSQALNDTAPGVLTALSQAAIPGEHWQDALQRIMTGLTMTDAQRAALNLNITRAQQGLPPVGIDGQPFLPTPDVQLDKTSTDQQKLLTWIGYGVLAYLAIEHLGKKE